MQGLKTFILMLFMTILLIFIGSIIGGKVGMLIGLILALISNFISYWFSDKIVLNMYRAQEVLPNHRIYKITEKLAMNEGIPTPKVYMIDEEQPNAFATGRNIHNAAIAVTKGLQEIMTDEELSGVIGHELGHVVHRDILIQTVAATMGGAIAYLANLAQWGAIFGDRRDENEQNNTFSLIAVSIFAPIAATLIQMAISRSREYKADSFGAKISGNPMYLAKALEKLEIYSEKIKMPAMPSTESMFIVTPLSGQKMVNLFSTHPSTADRIKRLKEMLNN